MGHAAPDRSEAILRDAGAAGKRLMPIHQRKPVEAAFLQARHPV
jgi:hypothetical protein